MINNRCLWAALLTVVAQASLTPGCRPSAAEDRNKAFQGVVELEEVTLGFELGGRITRVLVAEGDVVEAGALLARLDDELERTARDAQAGQVEVARQQVGAVRAGARSEELRALQSRVDAAKATEELLQKQVARERTLVEKGALAPASLDEVEAQLARASAERASLEHSWKLLRQGARSEDVSVAQARERAASAALASNDARLVRHELRAPSAGTVLDVSFEQGEVVGAGAAAFTLADVRRPYVDVFVPQAQISAVSQGASARVRVDALERELPGRVEHVARRTEFTPRYLFSDEERAALVVRVRVRVDDAQQQLRAGVPAFVRLGVE